MAFHLGMRSRLNLRGVDPRLVRTCELALTEFARVDWSVICGLRTAKQQALLVEQGASQTLDSRHLTGHAVDLAAYVGGKLHFDWPLCYPVAQSMVLAARELKMPLRWGGCWDKKGEELDAYDLEGEVLDYAERRRRLGKKPFLDGYHFEIPK